jgi:hypothetical protein
VTLDTPGLVAGCALLAAGRFDAARVAFARAASDPADPLAAGLLAGAAALDAAARGDTGAARRRAARARSHLAAATGPVETGPLRAALAAPVDPSRLRLRVEGAPADPEALSLDALARAAAAVAAVGPYDQTVVADAARYARAEAAAGRGRFGTLLTDVVVDREAGLAYGRLRALVERRRARERDVDGLF